MRLDLPKFVLFTLGFCLISGCAFFAADEDSKETRTDHEGCSDNSQCVNGQVCNLVSQVCTPTGVDGVNRFKADFVCPIKGNGQTQPGPAFAAFNTAAQEVTFGAGCIAKVDQALGLTTLLMAGNAADGSSWAVAINFANGASGALSTPGVALAYIDQMDANQNRTSIAASSSGNIDITTSNRSEIRGNFIVNIQDALGRNAPCSGQTHLCGSIGSGRSCIVQDPSGQATCRDICFDVSSCDGGETCQPYQVNSSASFCFPAGLLTIDQACASDAECTGSERCLRGQYGAPEDLFCRSLCNSNTAPSCGETKICVELASGINGEGVCLPNPCSFVTCGSDMACAPASAIDAMCKSASKISGLFDLTISPSSDDLKGGTAAGVGVIPDSGAWSANGIAVALLLDGDSGPILSIAIGGDDSSNQRDIYFEVPLKNIVVGERLSIVFQFRSPVVQQLGGEYQVIAYGIEGFLQFTSVGTRVGDQVAGIFDIWYTANLQ